VKLTERTVPGLRVPAGKTEAIIFDDDIGGFGLRLRSGGSRVWVFQYKVGDKGRRISFGKYPAVTPKKAREQAAEFHARVRLGQDPAGEKAKSRTRAAETFGAIQQKFLAFQQSRLRRRSFIEVVRHLQAHAKPLHGYPLSGIDRRQIAARLSEVADGSGPIAANRTRATLSTFFSWAIREGLAESNPASFTNKREERSRERVLGDEELRLLWRGLPDNDYGRIVRLLLLTAMRRAEVAELRWQEIDFDTQTILLPGQRVKNGNGHRVPMSPAVHAILAGQPRRSDFVFSSRRADNFNGWANAKRELDEKVPLTAPWVLHDLRRTAATRMADLGVHPHIVEAVLNHTGGHKAGIAGVYNHARYEPEKSAALNLWADHVTKIVAAP
jgi:integrase